MKKKLYPDEGFVKSFQQTIWQEFSPRERLRHSWSLRKRLKNIEKIHDKKIFPRP